MMILGISGGNMNKKRIHKRVSFRSKIWCYKYYDANGIQKKFDDPVQLDVINLSLSGFGIVSATEFTSDMTLEFTLYLEDIPYPVMTKIVWDKKTGNLYKYGVEIIGHNNMFFRHLKLLIDQGSMLDFVKDQ